MNGIALVLLKLIFRVSKAVFIQILQLVERIIHSFCYMIKKQKQFNKISFINMAIKWLS